MRRLLAVAAAWRYLLTSLLLVMLQPPAAASCGATAGPTEWQVLTRANFSSQIRLHPHTLVLVTMPWYGESRSLMTNIGHLIAADEQNLGCLRLMVVYRNSEKLLADAIGATEGIKFIYYQHSVPFKYQGKLRARDILSSIYYIQSLKHEEAPFVVLHTKEDVKTFVESTDKAVLLSEFCGWFTRLTYGGSNRTYEATSSKIHKQSVDIAEETITRESVVPLELVIENEELSFGGGGPFTGSPWKGGFTLPNESVSDQIESTTDGNRKLCTAQKFKQFESFYTNLTSISREYSIPSKKVRFGLVTERSSLLTMDAVREDNPEAWFLSIIYLGCTACSVIAKEGDDLRSLLQSHNNLDIKEIDGDENGVGATFPANRPSAVLYIDRLSDSTKVRDESKSSLKLLREYVQKTYPSHVSISSISSDNSRMHSKMVHSIMSTGISDGHSEKTRLNAWASKFMKLGEKMPVMVVNDGESISYRTASHGNADNPLYDIITNLLHKTRLAHRSKKTRISLVAKDLGLKLLSDGSNEQVMESLSKQESQCESTDDSLANPNSVNADSAEASVHENEAIEAGHIDDGQTPSILEKKPANVCYINDNDFESCDTELVEEDKTEVSNSDVSFDQHKIEKIVTEALDIVEPDGRHVQYNQEKSGPPNQQNDEFSVLGQESGIIKDAIYEYNNVLNLDEGSEESDSKYSTYATFGSSSSLVSDTGHTEQATSSISKDLFVGSFFFCDGGYRLLRALTGGSRIPTLVIIDPIQQKHYVFPQEIDFSYPSLANYFESFMNRSLSSYHRSASSVLSSKELPRPPFVNRDFHEANSIPQLTTNSFCLLVYGFKDCDSKNEMSFPNTENIPTAWKNDVLVLFSNSWCGFCQRSELVVREVYRSFKSFISSNSQRANAQYLQIEEQHEESTMEGFPAIYLMDCTSNECHHILKSAGKEELYPMLLLFPAKNKSAISYEGGMSVANLIEFLESHVSNSCHLSEYKGFLWKKRTTMQPDAPEAIHFQISDKSSSRVDFHSSNHPERHTTNIVTGSILTASEKLGPAVPFDNSQVLIVSVDSHEGFHGLIINKRLSWDVFKNLDSSMEPIKQAPLFYGGPVVVQGYHLVSLSRVAFEGYTQVIPGVYYGNIIATSRVVKRVKSNEQSAVDLWFFLGYSGWGYNQLFDELSEGAWHASGEPVEHLDWPES